MKASACCVCAALVLASACGNRAARPVASQSQKLAPGVAALVGADAISIATVRQIANAQHVPPERARKLAVEDALFAAAARARWSGTGWVAAAEDTSLARALLEQLQARAGAAGPPTDAEVAKLTAKQWVELDRPPAARTTHAVVLVKKPSDDARAKALAERIARAVHGVSDPAEFKELAKAVPTDGLKVHVEDLPPVTADGRVVPAPGQGESAGRFDPQFAAAANAIPAVGDQSPVVKSAFGYHVILLDARLPAKRVPLEKRRALLADHVIDERARAAQSTLLKKLTSATRIEVARTAIALTGRVRVDR
jgi:parvulin-like peptidyl-prolyl isomerase